MSTFYPQNDYRGYLSHHGIKGQKWGEQNGPPYPLSNKIHNMIVRGKQKRAAKRREKILHDPRKLSKHASEFTKEEIDEAVAKIDSINQAKNRIKPTKLETIKANRDAARIAAKKAKEDAKQQKKLDNKLTKKIEKYAPDIMSLEHNVKKFNSQELQVALNRLGNKDKMFDIKMNQLNKPKKILDIGISYLQSIVNGITAFTGLEKAMGIDTRDPNKLTYEEKHREFVGKLFDQGIVSGWIFKPEDKFKYSTAAKTVADAAANAKKAQAEAEKTRAEAEKASAEARAATERARSESRRDEERAKYYSAASRKAESEARYYDAQAANIAWSAVQTRVSEIPDSAAERITQVIMDKEGKPIKYSDIEEILSVSFSDIDKKFSAFYKK